VRCGSFITLPHPIDFSGSSDDPEGTDFDIAPFGLHPDRVGLVVDRPGEVDEAEPNGLVWFLGLARMFPARVVRYLDRQFTQERRQ
jgi:hypothetical protein